jgi:uncharacterized protein (UPF0218 family)
MLVLPEGMREEVRKPFGPVLPGQGAVEACRKGERPLVAVGDQCAADLIDAGIAPDVLIFDFKIKRVEIPQAMKEKLAPHAKSAYVVLSSAGSISEELEISVSRVLSEGKGAIMVASEDDLSALLVMARAERGTLVYGQPDAGAVVVGLGGKEVKERAQGLLKRMRRE